MPSGAADIFVAVGGGEAEVAAKSGAENVAVEEMDEAVRGKKFPFKRGGQSGFARAAQAGEPDNEAGLAVADFTFGDGDGRRNHGFNRGSSRGAPLRDTRGHFFGPVRDSCPRPIHSTR